MRTHDLAVFGVVAVKAKHLKPFRPSVSTQPSIHAGATFTDLLSVLGSRTTLNVIDCQKYWPTLAATSAGFAVVPECLEFYV